jgi:hypothetical protein
MVWNNNGKVTVVVGGKTFQVERNEPFVATIKKLTTQCGLSTFNVSIDGGREFDVSEAPLNFAAVKETVTVMKQIDPMRQPF